MESLLLVADIVAMLVLLFWAVKQDKAANGHGAATRGDDGTRPD